MQYRGFSFNVVQGFGRKFWRWFATIKGIELSGDAATEAEATSEAQQAIDRAIKLVGPRTSGEIFKQLQVCADLPNRFRLPHRKGDTQLRRLHCGRARCALQ